MHDEAVEQRDEMLDLLQQILQVNTRQKELGQQIVELLLQTK